MKDRPDIIDPLSGQVAVQVARNSLEQYVREHTLYEPNLDERQLALGEKGACFVTLTNRGLLRGCMGHTEAKYPLAEDVARNATAASRDFRFSPVLGGELADIRLEVTILSPLRQLRYAGFEDLIQSLRPDVDGVMLTWQMKRGLLLPQVWRRLPKPAEFLEAIAIKAGLPFEELRVNPPTVVVHTFQVQHFAESGYREPGN
ncbi:MAG TPA: AmmeMemoRadiSam system protein A [Patescibacteria group bacterium]|nr:AmmeMemoRadiSam system protein A [Patescibacteria group bacterium]